MGTVNQRPPLSQEELDACRDAFLMFDKDRSGSIDVWELKLVLVAMGQNPSEEEVFEIIASMDDDCSGSIGESPDYFLIKPAINKFKFSPSFLNHFLLS